jgi:nitrile hydratase
VSRINDVGGMTGFPPVVEEPDEPPFHADWEAHVMALNAAMVRRGVYTLDEFRDAIERMPPQEYLAASYYERWFAAITALLAAKGVATPEELQRGDEGHTHDDDQHDDDAHGHG